MHICIFFNTGLTVIKPLFWHLIVIGISMSLLVLNRPITVPVVSTNLGVWFWLFTCSTIICFFYSSQGQVEVQALIANIEMIVLFYSFLVLFQINGAIHTIRLALLLVVIFSVVMNIIDFISPAWSAVPGRAAGFYQNPNVAGLNMIMAMLASIPLLPRRLRLFFCIFVGLGVFLTFSRGAWLSWIIALGGLAAIGYLNIGRKNFSIIFISLVAGVRCV